MTPLANYHFNRLFSPDEANTLVPMIEPLIRRLQGAARELREQIQGLLSDDPEIDQMQLPTIIERHPHLRELASRMADTAHEIESHGCFLKDIDLGLIDFPWEIDEGNVVFLCWQPGEREIVAWHPLDAGFAQRQPIPGVAKQYLN